MVQTHFILRCNLCPGRIRPLTEHSTTMTVALLEGHIPFINVQFSATEVSKTKKGTGKNHRMPLRIGGPLFICTTGSFARFILRSRKGNNNEKLVREIFY